MKLEFESGAPVATHPADGGFVFVFGPRRSIRGVTAFDSAGRELERIDLSGMHPGPRCLDGFCPP